MGNRSEQATRYVRWFITSWLEEYAIVYSWTLRKIPPFRWAAGLLFLPGTASGDAVRSLPFATSSGDR